MSRKAPSIAFKTLVIGPGSHIIACEECIITSQDIRSKTHSVKGDFRVSFSQELLKCHRAACGYWYKGELVKVSILKYTICIIFMLNLLKNQWCINCCIWLCKTKKKCFSQTIYIIHVSWVELVFLLWHRV